MQTHVSLDYSAKNIHIRIGTVHELTRTMLIDRVTTLSDVGDEIMVRVLAEHNITKNVTIKEYIDSLELEAENIVQKLARSGYDVE